MATLLHGIDPRLAFLAITLAVRLKTFGVLPKEFDTLSLDMQQLEVILTSLHDTGFEFDFKVRDLNDLPPELLIEKLDSVLKALETFYFPCELKSALQFLNQEQLASLIGIQEIKLNEIRSKNLSLPEEFAERLHYLLLILAALSGTYQNKGIRDWFNRKRSALGNKAPADFMHGDWKPQEEKIRIIRALAQKLVSLGAT